MWQPQQITNRYEVINQLGEGGMGTVYQVYDRLEKDDVALKVVNASPDDLQFASKGTLENKKAAIIQEFSILASLRHPHIISVLDYGLFDGQPFFTMELALQAQDFFQATQTLSPVEQVELLIQVLEALRYLHRRGVIHRDLKPFNVLVLGGNQAKVLDFGLSINAKVATGRAGTLMYMAPETIKSQIAMPQSDLYAVGVMAYQMISGELPFAPRDIMGIVARLPDMTKLGNHPASAVIERLLLKDPKDRYVTVDDAIRAFQKAMEIPTEIENITVRESFLQASKFVGREAELKTLTDKLDVVLQGNTAFYLIGGESGVGKSRLMDELRIQALVTGATVLRGQAVDNGRPFQLWRSIVRHLLLMVDVNDLQAGVLIDIIPDIADIVGRKVERAPELTEKAYLDRLVLTIVDLFSNLNQPLVLLLEDLQWADEGLAVLKQLLLAKEQFHQLMVVGNYRNDEAPTLPDDLAGIGLMRLDRLTRNAMKNLSISMLGKQVANEQIITFLQKETEGNLFFLVETVRALAEEAGRLDLVGKVSLPDQVFTGGMQQVIQRKLNKVDEEYLPIQQLAAVIEREIDIDLLAQQYKRSQVEDWLINASEASLIDIEGNAWRFAHDKLREAVLAEIPEDDLIELHHNAALCIEAVYPDDANYNEILLEHWQYTQNLDKIYQYVRPVSQRLLQVTGAYDSAQMLVEQVLAQLGKDDARRVPLLNIIARKYELQGNFSDANRVAEDARQLAAQVHDIAGLGRSLTILGNVARFQGEYNRAIELYQQSIDKFQDIDDQRSVAHSLGSLGIIAGKQGRFKDATELYQQSLDILQDIGDQRSIVMSLNGMAIVASRQGDDTQATELFEQCLQVLQTLGDRRRVAGMLNNLGIMAEHRGDYWQAIELHQQGLTIARQLGDLRSISDTLHNLGIAEARQGDYGQATIYLRESLNICQELGIQDGIAESLDELGQVAQAQGDYESALEFFGQSLSIHQKLGEQYNIAEVQFHIGWITYHQGHDNALSYFIESLQIAHDINTPTWKLYNVIGFALVLNKRGQWLRAGELLGMVQQHPAFTKELHARWNEALHAVEVRLSSQDMQDALERGTKLDLDAVVQELLTTFAGSSPA